MEIRNRTTGAITSVDSLKKENPNTSFPKAITDDILDAYGYDLVLVGQQPDISGPYAEIARQGEEEIDGKWYSKFVVVTRTDEEEAAHRAEIDALIAADVRRDRDRKLADTDWTQLADSSANATAWGTYRQALRDLPSAEGFPHNVTWPTEPS
jgi:hypothetical protein